MRGCKTLSPVPRKRVRGGGFRRKTCAPAAPVLPFPRYCWGWAWFIYPKSGIILSQYLPVRDECRSVWYNSANGFQNSMLPTPKNRLRGLTASECQRLREMCRLSQNLSNLVCYNSRQNYTHHGRFIPGEDNSHDGKNNEKSDAPQRSKYKAHLLEMGNSRTSGDKRNL